MESVSEHFSPIKDLNMHRTCDIRDDRKMATIQRDGCLTIITVNPDGTLNISFKYVKAA